MKNPVFKGSCTAMITPFDSGGLNETQMKKLIAFQRDHGSSALVVAGTTGESATLDIHEYERLVDFSIQEAGGSMKIIAGIGGNCTQHCLERGKFAQSMGADAVLMSTPYYNKTTLPGLLRHFNTVADALEIPLILYNVPSRTAIGIPPEAYCALARHPNINGVKEASGDFSLIAYLASTCGDSLNLWCGNDDQTVPMMALGAKGVISVASNLVPGEISRLCACCLSGNYTAALEIFKEYASLCRLLFSETNPIPVKTAMALLGLDSGRLRLPLVEMGTANREMLKACLKRLAIQVEEKYRCA